MNWFQRWAPETVELISDFLEVAIASAWCRRRSGFGYVTSFQHITNDPSLVNLLEIQNKSKRRLIAVDASLTSTRTQHYLEMVWFVLLLANGFSRGSKICSKRPKSLLIMTYLFNRQQDALETALWVGSWFRGGRASLPQQRGFHCKPGSKRTEIAQGKQKLNQCLQSRVKDQLWSPRLLKSWNAPSQPGDPHKGSLREKGEGLSPAT